MTFAGALPPLLVGAAATDGSKFAAVVSFGQCTAALVGARTLLTAGHCTEMPSKEVAIGGKRLGVTGCVRPPDYAVNRVADDIGVCTLSAPAAVAPLVVEDGELHVGQQVILAGWGATGLFAREPERLRAVETTVAKASKGTAQVGTPDRTACHGDSGAPVLVHRDDGMHVLGIVRGTSGVICGSPADAMTVRGHAAWLESAGVTMLRGSSSGRIHQWWSGLAIVVLAVLCISRRLRARGSAARSLLR